MSDRSELEMKLLCAWNGVEELPTSHHAHTNPATERAWGRVAKAMLSDIQDYWREHNCLDLNDYAKSKGIE